MKAHKSVEFLKCMLIQSVNSTEHMQRWPKVTGPMYVHMYVMYVSVCTHVCTVGYMGVI